MPRRARAKSVSGYSHMIVRGNNKQILFEEEEDYKFFIKRMGEYSREEETRICAYCLMDNHAHILTCDQEGRAGKMMGRLTTSYAQYYNRKYERNGHVFQGRYLSEPVNDEAYLLTVFRYILNNPKKAGICPAEMYRWSSYKAYFREKTSPELGFVRDRLGTDAAYREFIGAENDDECLEYDQAVNPDGKAIEVIRECLGIGSGTELQQWEKKERDAALRLLKEKGLSVRQIERLTGISKSLVQRA